MGLTEGLGSRIPSSVGDETTMPRERHLCVKALLSRILISVMPTRSPQVCKLDLLWASWSPRVCLGVQGACIAPDFGQQATEVRKPPTVNFQPLEINAGVLMVADIIVPHSYHS